jgi:hypothetical protein
MREDSTALYETIPTSDYENCVPFTLIQGPETWGFHLTIAESGLWTKNGDCTWKGAFTTASLTCYADLAGTALLSGTLTETTTLGHEELRSSTAFAVATIVTAEATGGSSTGPAKTQSTGLAPSVALPTGGMALVGAAAGILAAAWAL